MGFIYEKNKRRTRSILETGDLMKRLTMLQYLQKRDELLRKYLPKIAHSKGNDVKSELIMYLTIDIDELDNLYFKFRRD